MTIPLHRTTIKLYMDVDEIKARIKKRIAQYKKLGLYNVASTDKIKQDVMAELHKTMKVMK